MAAVAAEQWGVLSVPQLLACGLSYGAIRTRKRTGRFHELHRGVVAVGHSNPPWQGRLLAAVLACGPTAVLSHHAAAALWGFAERDANRFPEVTVVGPSTRLHRGIRVHRTAALDPRDRRRCQGVPVTSPARSLLDRAQQLDPRALQVEVRRAQALGTVGHRELVEVLVRLAPRRGSRRLAIAIANGPQPTKNVFEDLVLDALLDAGFVPPDVNKPLVIEGRRLVPDFRWPQRRLIVEADSRAWHAGEAARAEDDGRQALLEAAGERVLRVTWAQIVARRAATVARVGAAGAPSVDPTRRRASGFFE